jgi:hypothetical protein
MTALSAPTLQSAPATLRPLSGYERLFWAVEKVNGFNFGIAVTFRGNRAHSQWEDAFAQVQKRHPFLNVAINDDDPQAPHFVYGTGLPIPLAFLRRNSPADWQRAMENEVAEPFDLKSGPLLRADLLEDEEGCDLVVVANHIVIDGMGVLALVRDLLRALSGEALAELPVPPPAEERAAQVRASNPLLAPPIDLDAIATEPQPRNRTYASRNRIGKAAIAALRFSTDETAQLKSFARREQTTIGAVLLAAVACVLRELSPQLKEVDLRLGAAVDVRPYLSNNDDFVLSIISARAIVPYPDQELAASARAIKSQIVLRQSFAAVEATFVLVDAVLAQGFDADVLVSLVAQGFGHDVLASNLKTVEFPSGDDGFAAEAVWGPSVLAGYEGEHAIGSATFDGALHLVYTSFTPVAGLLEAVREKIVSACGAS